MISKKIHIPAIIHDPKLMDTILEIIIKNNLWHFQNAVCFLCFHITAWRYEYLVQFSIYSLSFIVVTVLSAIYNYHAYKQTLIYIGYGLVGHLYP